MSTGQMKGWLWSILDVCRWTARPILRIRSLPDETRSLLGDVLAAPRGKSKGRVA